MVRSAAKNFESVAIVVDPNDYSIIINDLKDKKKVSDETKKSLAVKAYQHTARYDAIISGYLNEKINNNPIPDH